MDGLLLLNVKMNSTEDTDVSPLSCNYVVVGQGMKLTVRFPTLHNCTLPFHEYLRTLKEVETE
jgi:hypothetical protein